MYRPMDKEQKSPSNMAANGQQKKVREVEKPAGCGGAASRRGQGGRDGQTQGFGKHNGKRPPDTRDVLLLRVGLPSVSAGSCLRICCVSIKKRAATAAPSVNRCRKIRYFDMSILSIFSALSIFTLMT